MTDERSRHPDHATHGEPERDPELAAVLRGAAGEPPIEHVDWTDLHTRIVAAGELPLARRRRHTASFWGVAARWSRAAGWAAVAAGILFALAIRASDRAPVRSRAISAVDPAPSGWLVTTAIAEDRGVALLFGMDRAAVLQAALELE